MHIKQSLLAEITSELDKIEFNDNESLSSLLRKTEVYIKKVFGNESDYYERYCHLSFIPKDAIYNTGHYKNQEAWNIGISQYKSLLESLKYEFELKHISNNSPIEYPNKITMQWLKTHVPMQIWFSFAGIMMAVFLAGVSVGKSNLAKLFGEASEISTPNTAAKNPTLPASSISVPTRKLTKYKMSSEKRVLLNGRALEITTSSYTGAGNREIEEIKSATLFCNYKGHKGLYTKKIGHFTGTPVPSWRFNDEGVLNKYSGESSFTEIVCIDE